MTSDSVGQGSLLARGDGVRSEMTSSGKDGERVRNERQQCTTVDEREGGKERETRGGGRQRI